MVKSIEELVQNRQELITAQQKNDGFSDGIRILLTDLYPDTAHFIYELLQNAEDMNANTVRFMLSENGIDFEHNGTKRDFNLSDIDAITNIGNNVQKRNDTTSIGKFGVGFKAVFTYTSTPEIHSGENHFRIKDYFVPDFNDVPKISTRDSKGVSWTKFYFPFDHPKKDSRTAYKEILEGLKQLNDLSILFLKNIKYIEYLLPDSSLGYVQCIEDEPHFITIFSKQHDMARRQEQKWLRFQHEISIMDDRQNQKELTIAVAYSIKINAKTDKPQIVPVEGGGKTFIYFPAEKEYSGLRFHINAPFASTVARDSIRNCEDNNKLIKEIGKLVSESIGEIKKLGLLNVSFFSVLPNPKDNLSFFYQYILDFVYNAFYRFEYLPTKGGGFTNASAALRGSSDISNLFNNVCLGHLDSKHKKWILNAPQRNSLEDQFICGLDIVEFSYKEFLQLFENSQNELESFIAQQNDDWLKRFYLVCAEIYQNARFDIKSMRKCKMIRSTKNTMHTSDEIFILPVNNRLLTQSTPIVNQEFLKNKKTKDFFEDTLEIKQYGPKIETEKLLSSILERRTIDETYFSAMLTFAKYFACNISNSQEQIDFSKYKIFVFEQNESLLLTTASNLVLCKSYNNPIGDILSKVYNKNCLWKGYKDKYLEKDLEIFLTFVEKMGMLTKLKIIKQDATYHPKFRVELYISGRPTEYGVSSDYTIENLRKLLEQKSIKISRQIWELLRTSGRSVASPYAFAHYSPNGTTHVQVYDSSLIYYLRTSSWIPNKTGEMFKPEDIQKEDIHSSFQVDKNNVLLDALKIGNSVIVASKKVIKIEEDARAIGKFLVDLSDWEDVQKFLTKKHYQKEIESKSIPELLVLQTKKEKPNGGTRYDGTLPNIQKSIENIEATFRNSKKMIPVLRQMFSRILDSTHEEKNILAKWYNGKCQMCNTVIIGYNAVPHFIAKNIINTEMLTRELKSTMKIGWNSLCLCPNCAAKYLVCSRDISSLYRQIIDREIIDCEDKRIILTIELDRKEQQIHYVQQHFLALQQVFLLFDDMNEEKPLVLV